MKGRKILLTGTSKYDRPTKGNYMGWGERQREKGKERKAREVKEREKETFATCAMAEEYCRR